MNQVVELLEQTIARKKQSGLETDNIRRLGVWLSTQHWATTRHSLSFISPRRKSDRGQDGRRKDWRNNGQIDIYYLYFRCVIVSISAWSSFVLADLDFDYKIGIETETLKSRPVLPQIVLLRWLYSYIRRRLVATFAKWSCCSWVLRVREALFALKPLRAVFTDTYVSIDSRTIENCEIHLLSNIHNMVPIYSNFSSLSAIQKSMTELSASVSIWSSGGQTQLLLLLYFGRVAIIKPTAKSVARYGWVLLLFV